MKLLKTMTYPGFPEVGIETITREAARIVLVDDDWMVPLVYSSKNYLYQIAGGWIDEGESILGALHREALEETGCEIEVLWEIGSVIDERPASVCKFWKNLIQTSYCFYGRITKKWLSFFTDEEIEHWYEIVWIHVEDVLEKMKNTKVRIPKAEIEAKRDAYIFEEYLKVLGKK